MMLYNAMPLTPKAYSDPSVAQEATVAMEAANERVGQAHESAVHTKMRAASQASGEARYDFHASIPFTILPVT